MILRSNEQVGKETTLKKCKLYIDDRFISSRASQLHEENFTRITGISPPEPFICINESKFYNNQTYLSSRAMQLHGEKKVYKRW